MESFTTSLFNSAMKCSVADIELVGAPSETMAVLAPTPAVVEEAAKEVGVVVVVIVVEAAAAAAAVVVVVVVVEVALIPNYTTWPVFPEPSYE